jgi:hypothetical protein
MPSPPSAPEGGAPGVLSHAGRGARSAAAIGRDHLADDGSADGSADRLDAIAETDPRVCVLHMSRNYGQTAALMAAIQNSSGDVVIPMDGDG